MTTDRHLLNWADTELSNDLPVLRSRGENQDLEYMASFPTNTRELAKEIAAFATSNDGIILIGVSDEGELLGLDDAKTSQGRDQLLRRVEGDLPRHNKACYNTSSLLRDRKRQCCPGTDCPKRKAASLL